MEYRSPELAPYSAVDERVMRRFDGQAVSWTAYLPELRLIATTWYDYSAREDIQRVFEYRLELMARYPEAIGSLFDARAAYGPIASLQDWFNQKVNPLLAKRPVWRTAIVAPEAVRSQLEARTAAEHLEKLGVPVRLFTHWTDDVLRFLTQHDKPPQ